MEVDFILRTAQLSRPQYVATTENLGIKACDRDKSGVYTKVNEHFVEGA